MPTDRKRRGDTPLALVVPKIRVVCSSSCSMNPQKSREIFFPYYCTSPHRITVNRTMTGSVSLRSNISKCVVHLYLYHVNGINTTKACKEPFLFFS